MTKRISVALLPALGAGIEADAFVVVDLFRATTTIATWFARGVERLTVVAGIEPARELAAKTGALLCGEQGGLPPPGFDHGNSPLEALSVHAAGRDIVLATTNGTKALCAFAGRGEVFTGAVANVAAVVDAVSTFERIAIICAGNEAGTTPSLEDLGGAGAIVGAFALRHPDTELSDMAELARLAWTAGGPPLLARSEHARTLARIGLTPDVAFCLQPDTSPVAPRVARHGEGWAELSLEGAPKRRG